MRQPQQQNRRGRGRGRKPQNPLQRGYESNGPDIKIRGNAAHIAEKYVTLARDALSSGDTIMAENYLQHAEHYNRIIASAQQQMDSQGQGGAPNGQANGQGRGRRNNNSNGAEPNEEPAKETAAQSETRSSDSGEDTPPKPTRRRKPQRTKAKASDDSDASGSGPIRMGDVPMDEAAG